MANIIVPDCSVVEGNPNSSTTQCNPALYWAFTLNNYTKQDIEYFRNIDSSKVPRLVFQEEIGASGTPHLQGALMFKTKRRPMTLMPHRRTHWENKHKNSTVKQFFDYCVKKDTRIPGGIVYCRGWEKPYELSLELYEWQDVIAEELKRKPDDRTINWIWEPEGGAGKTTFQKWVFSNYEKCVVLCGKASDMKNGILEYQKTAGFLPKIILMNVPRTSLDYLSYTGLEEIKDMFFYSGKYEGGMVCGESPHVYIFANKLPIIENVSQDRWNIRRIDEKQLI